MAVVIITPDAVVRVSFVITKLYNIQPYLCLRNIVLIGHADNYLIVSTLWLMTSSLEQAGMAKHFGWSPEAFGNVY